jgi:hypothetical protein
MKIFEIFINSIIAILVYLIKKYVKSLILNGIFIYLK